MEKKFTENSPKMANFRLILAKNMVNFNLNFQKLAKSNQKSQKLDKNDNLNYFPTTSRNYYWELGSQVPTQFPRLPIDFWRNSDLFEKKEHFSSSKTAKVRAFLHKSIKFLIGNC